MAATTYTVTVTDPNGCIDNASLDVTVTASPPAPVAADPTPICENDAIPSLTAAGAGIQWYDDILLTNLVGAGSPFTPTVAEVDNTTAGTYLLYVTQTVAGCESPATTVTVLVNPDLIADAGVDVTICDGETTILGGAPTGTGGSGTYTYAWLPIANLDDATIANPTFISSGPMAATTYTVTVTDPNGCTDNASLDVTVTASPPAPVAADPTPICENDAIPSLTAAGAGIQWYDDILLTNLVGAGSPFTPTVAEVDNTTASTYLLYLTQTVAGCESPATTVTVLVNPDLIADAGVDVTICDGETTILGGAPTGTGGSGTYTYAWLPIANLDDATIANPTFISSGPMAATTYTVTVTDPNGCTDNASLDVTVTASPPAPVAADPTPICENDAIPSLTAAGAGIQWYDDILLTNLVGAGSPFTPTVAEVDNTTAGTYLLYVTQTVAGCESPATTVTVLVNPDLIADAGVDVTICDGETTILGGAPTGTGGSGSYTYAWLPIANLDDATIANPTFTSSGPMAATTYTVTITDPNGCTDNASLDVTVNELPTFTLTNNISSICVGSVTDIDLNTLTAGATITLTSVVPSDPGVGGFTLAGATYVVFPANIADALTNSTNSPQTVTYEFEIDANGCTNPVRQTTIVTINPTPVFTLTNNIPSICSGENTDIDIGSPTSGAVITLIAVTPSDPGISGFTAVGANYLNGNKLTDNLLSIVSTIETVTYTFEVAANGCTNPITQNAIVSVNPSPVQVITNNLTDICEGSTTDIDLNSSTANAVIEIVGITLSDPGVGGFTPVTTTFIVFSCKYLGCSNEFNKQSTNHNL